MYRSALTRPRFGLRLRGLTALAISSVLGVTGLVVLAAPVHAATADPIVYVTNVSSGTVSAIDAATGTIVATIPVGADPIGVAVSPDDSTVYVTNERSNNVSVISTGTNTVTATIPVGVVPDVAAVSPDGSLLYVGNNIGPAIGGIDVIDTATDMVVATIQTSNQPDGIAFTADGTEAFVANFVGSSVSVIDTATSTVIATIASASASTPSSVAISPDGAYAYATNFNSNNVSVISTATNTITTLIPGFNGPGGVSISPDGAHVYVTNENNNTVSVIDPATNTITATIPVGSVPDGIVADPAGGTAYVANLSSNTVSVIDTTLNTITATIPVGSLPLNLAMAPAPPAVTALSTASGPDNGGGTVTITGTQLAGTSKVMFGSTPATNVTVVNALTVTATIPANTPSTVDVTVTTPAGTSATSSADHYTYVAPVVVVDVSGSQTYGSSSPTFTYTAPSLPPGVTLSGSLTCTTAGGAALSALGVAGSPYGLDGTSCSGLSPSDPAYSLSYTGVSGAFIVNPAPLVITASSPTMTYGGTVPAVTASYATFVNGDSASSLTTPPTCTTTATASSPPGSYSSSCSGAVDANYSISYVAGSVKVAAASTSTSLYAVPPGPVPAGGAVLYVVTVSQGSAPAKPTGTVSFTNDGSAIAACGAVPVVLGVSACLTRFGAGGSYTITATYEGNTDLASSAASLDQVVYQAPAITSANHATTSVGAVLSFQVTATGSPTPSFTETGSLPKGVSLSSSGLLSGTPATGTGGSYAITIIATSTAGTARQSFTVVVGQAPSITSANHDTVALGKHFSFQVTAGGYPAPSFTETGSLPKGVSLSSSGLLSGTPTSTGTYTITISATNTAGTATQGFTLVT